MMAPPREPLTQFRTLHDSLALRVSKPIQFPEPALKLDPAARQNSLVRLFTHFHQMCFGHSLIFYQTNQIKLLYLIDAYIRMAEAQNPLGTYGSARALLEFTAFIHEVYIRLKPSASQSKANWRQAGEQFFAIIIRARSGTSDPAKMDLLRNSGAPAGALKPFHIKDCINNLAKEAGHDSAISRYDSLCDFVHHNLSSQTLGNVGSAISSVARSFGGGAIVLPKPGAITQFQYPIPSKAKLALDATASFAYADAKASLNWINATPMSPYSPEHVMEITGHQFGFRQLKPPRLTSTSPHREMKVGRNDQCPCGSKKKYKKCCGAN